MNEIGYGREITDNVRGFIKVRIASLRLGTTGRFFEGGHPLDIAALLDRNVVPEIEDVGDDADKAFLIGTVLIRLASYLRMRQREEGPAPARLRHLTVIEEARRLLRNPAGRTGPAAHAVEMFAGLLAEVRAYGEGLVIASGNMGTRPGRVSAPKAAEPAGAGAVRSGGPPWPQLPYSSRAQVPHARSGHC